MTCEGGHLHSIPREGVKGKATCGGFCIEISFAKKQSDLTIAVRRK